VASLELRKNVIILYADYQLAEGEDRCHAYNRYIDEKKNLEEQVPQESTAQKILGIERSFNDLIFWLQGQMGKKQGVSMTLDQLRCLTLFDLYTLKNRFKIEQPISSFDTSDE
jgi:hypothetical protein